MKYPETPVHFLARMLVETREGGQINSEDARRLQDLAQFGEGPAPTTMPEERRDGSKPIQPADIQAVAEGEEYPYIR